MMNPVDYWAATSGFMSQNGSSNPYKNFNSSVARGYGENFGNGSMLGSNFGLDQGFTPAKSATKSVIESFLADRQAEADMAVNALGGLTQLKIAGMQPEPQSQAAPQQRKPSTGDRLWGLGTAVASAGVGAAVTGLI